MDFIVNMTITTTVTAIGILLIKKIFRNKMSPKLHVLIWIILAIRILVPMLPESQLSIFNFVPMANSIDKGAYQPEQPKADIIITREDGIREDMGEDIQNISQSAHIDTNKSFSVVGSLVDNITYLWLIGAAISFSYFACIYILFSYRLRKVGTYQDDEAVRILDKYKNTLRIKRNISMVRYGDTPMLKGIFKPTIIIPEGYNTEDLKYVMIHELCHLKNGDILANLISTMLLCINWYNPIIWICHSVFRKDVELLCDQRVLGIIGQKKEYATLLLKSSFNENPLLPATTCMNSSKKEIKRRIYFMANYRKPARIWAVVIVISIGLLGAGCLSNKTTTTKGSAFSYEHLNSLMGKEKKIVLETLNIAPEADADLEVVGDSQETYTLKEPLKVNGKESMISIVFYNDIMMAYEYLFDTVEDGFTYAKEIRSKMGESYGDPTTYPTLENRFDDVKNVQDINVADVGVEFFEEWELENSKELMERLLDGIEAERLNVEVRLRCFLNEASMVRVSYSAVRKSLAPVELIGYISNFSIDDLSFDFDRIEWITLEDVDRIKELNIAEDMPGGFYIHNEDEEVINFIMADRIECNIVNLREMTDESVTIEEFAEYINKHSEFKIPFRIIVQDGYVVAINEQYLP